MKGNKKRAKKAGLAPGTLVHIGEQKIDKPRITLIDYDQESCQEKELKKVEECFPFKITPSVSWINIDGLHDVKVIEKIGARYDVSSLVLEDILHTTQRPKMEDHDSYMYVVLKMIRYDDQQAGITMEQISLILRDTMVISFQESVGDVFDAVRERIRNATLRIRKMGADYLLYALIDSIVDHYFIVLEKLGENIEVLQEQVAENPTEDLLHQIHKLKREVILLRKVIWPLRELVGNLQRSESELIRESTEMFLKDVYDHIFQVIDTTETYREMVSGLLDIYLSSISNRMNAVMKVLTIIATIFIPLTFIAGIYGMNFEYMPELKYKWAYPTVWLVMLVTGIIMLIFFRKRKWL
ncbi:MAG: magnesium/cobalt transporter CorA [Sedimentisphaerales bacterium]|nr:magnesium/cobalt transporter CorA [Sedimentisphaerales bacterium]